MQELVVQSVQIWCQRKSRRSILGKEKSTLESLLDRRTLLSFFEDYVMLLTHFDVSTNFLVWKFSCSVFESKIYSFVLDQNKE